MSELREVWVIADSDGRVLGAMSNRVAAKEHAEMCTRMSPLKPTVQATRYVPEPTPSDGSVKVDRRHREAAAMARYPQSGTPADGSWAREWVEGRFSNFGGDEDCLNAIAEALAQAEARGAQGRAGGELTAEQWKELGRLQEHNARSESWFVPVSHATFQAMLAALPAPPSPTPEAT